MPEGVVCCRCQYELTGLPLPGICPECATGIRESYTGDLSIYRHRAYIEALSSAVQSIAWSISGCIGALATFVALVVLGLIAASADLAILAMLAAAAFMCAIVALPIWIFWLWVRGWWRFAALADPVAESARMKADRSRLRIALIAQTAVFAMCAAFALGVVTMDTFASRPLHPATMRTGTIAGVVLASASTAFCVLCGMALVSDRLLRFGREVESRHARRAGRLFALAVCVLALGGIMPVVVRPETGACVLLVALVWVLAAFFGISQSVQTLHAITLTVRAEHAARGGQAAADASDVPMA